jgi:hypothetical protein
MGAKIEQAAGGRKPEAAVRLFALAAGNVAAEPVRRSGAKGAFATASVRVATEAGESLLVSVSGRAKLSSWTSKDGAEKHGISIVADEIAAMRPARRAAPRNAYERRGAGRPAGAGPVPMPDDRVDDLWPG